MTKALILAQIHRRMGALARVLKNPEIVTVEGEDDEILGDFLRAGAVDLATRTGRFDGSAELQVTAGIPYVLQPADLRKPIHATLDAGAGTTRLGLSMMDGADAIAESETEGVPLRYGLFNGQIYLDRTPATDGTLRLYYTRSSVIEQVDDGEGGTVDEILAATPPEFEEALVVYALYNWLDLANQPAAAQLQRAVYEQLVERARPNPQRCDRAQLKARF